MKIKLKKLKKKTTLFQEYKTTFMMKIVQNCHLMVHIANINAGVAINDAQYVWIQPNIAWNALRDM